MTGTTYSSTPSRSTLMWTPVFVSRLINI
jgi:hypothetical protein